MARAQNTLRYTYSVGGLDMREGFVVDLTTKRLDGERWDLSRDADKTGRASVPIHHPTSCSFLIPSGLQAPKFQS